MVSNKDDNKEGMKEIKEKQIQKKLVIGKEKVLKGLKEEKLSKVFLSSNCPDDVKKDLLYYAELVDVPVMVLELNNEELGVLCKKNFFAAAVAVLKD